MFGPHVDMGSKRLHHHGAVVSSGRVSVPTPPVELAMVAVPRGAKMSRAAWSFVVWPSAVVREVSPRRSG
jgi:hypothetical protein